MIRNIVKTAYYALVTVISAIWPLSAYAQPAQPSWTVGSAFQSSNSLLAFSVVERYIRDTGGNFKLVGGLPVESINNGMNALDFYHV